MGGGLVLHALLLAIALVSSAPSWQRQPGETCQNYAARIEADNHALWRSFWCGDGPCFRAFQAPGGIAYSAEGFSVHPYWRERQHGCDL